MTVDVAGLQMKQTLMQSKKSTWHGLKNVEVVGSMLAISHESSDE